MNPTVAYHKLNALLWLNRLPKATVVFVDNETLPNFNGITLHDGQCMFMRPVIVLNHTPRWGRILVHEMLHVAEPKLPHGKVFDFLAKQ